MYEYKIVQVPRDLVASVGSVQKGVAEEFMQRTIDTFATKGWEFYRVDSLTVTEKPGCLASLVGQKAEIHSLNVICFRREKQ